MTRARQCHSKLARLGAAAIGLLFGALSAAGPGWTAEFDPQVIYARSSPAVVFVLGVASDTQIAGTGSIIHRSGLVLTNAHVAMDIDSNKLFDRWWVFLKPERITGNNQKDLTRRFKAKVVALDIDLDLALLKLEQPPQSLPILAFGDSDHVKIGERVAAIGHPEQGGLWSLTTVVISAELEDFDNVTGKHMFQTEASLDRGNSGGPLVNADGQQVGINTAIAREAKDGLAITIGNFSVKAGVAKAWLAKQGVEVTVEAPHPATSVGSQATPAEPKPDDRQQVKPGEVLGPQKPAAATPAPKPAAESVPPPRPYNLDQLVKGLDRTEQDMEQQMQDMSAEIKKRR